MPLAIKNGAFSPVRYKSNSDPSKGIQASTGGGGRYGKLQDGLKEMAETGSKSFYIGERLGTYDVAHEAKLIDTSIFRHSLPKPVTGKSDHQPRLLGHKTFVDYTTGSASFRVEFIGFEAYLAFHASRHTHIKSLMAALKRVKSPHPNDESAAVRLSGEQAVNRFLQGVTPGWPLHKVQKLLAAADRPKKPSLCGRYGCKLKDCTPCILPKRGKHDLLHKLFYAQPQLPKASRDRNVLLAEMDIMVSRLREDAASDRVRSNARDRRLRELTEKLSQCIMSSD